MRHPTVIYNRWLPVRPFLAITICGVVFTRRKSLSADVLNHEAIHCRQQREWLYLPFFVLYLAEWLYYMVRYRDPMRAYRCISFEHEAYANQHDPDYLMHRRPYANYRRKH